MIEQIDYAIQIAAAAVGFGRTIVLFARKRKLPFLLLGGFYGNFLRYVWDKKLLRAACLFGLLCLGIIYHSIYNLLVSQDATARLIGYCIPLATMLGIALASRLRKHKSDHRCDDP